MGWCKFYQKVVEEHDLPVLEQKCRAPPSWNHDVLVCGDCEYYSDVPLCERPIPQPAKANIHELVNQGL